MNQPIKPNDALIRATVVQEAEQSDRMAAATVSDVQQQNMAADVNGSFPPALTQAEALAVNHAKLPIAPILPDAFVDTRDVADQCIE